MANFEADATETTPITKNPVFYSEQLPPDPSGDSEPSKQLEREETSNSNPTQNQLHRSLEKIKKTLWKLAWLFSPNPADVARKIKERDCVRSRMENNYKSRRTV